MRKPDNDSPRIGRAVVAGILALLGSGVFVGSAAAQGTLLYDFGDVEAWWNAHDCNAKRALLGSGGDGANEIDMATESSACKMFDGLTRTQRRLIEDFIEPATHEATGGNANNDVGPFASTRLWWNGIAECLVNQKLGGALPLSNTFVESTDPVAMLFCREYDGAGGLRATEKEIVDRIAMALSGRSGMMTTEEEAPALPLAGAGILGLLLAGRGAWLRRRA